MKFDFFIGAIRINDEVKLEEADLKLEITLDELQWVVTNMPATVQAIQHLLAEQSNGAGDIT